MQTEDVLTQDERGYLLMLARRAIEQAVCGGDAARPALVDLPPRLREPGTCFVTLTMRGGELRGCIGGLEAVQPLGLDVWEHAVAAALEDYRFLPIRPAEVSHLRIEISRLTEPRPLLYDVPGQLPDLLHPPVDGVVLREGARRATFLPQVWEKLPDPCEFLSHLCQKMGSSNDLWRQKVLRVEIYHVEEFHEQ